MTESEAFEIVDEMYNGFQKFAVIDWEFGIVAPDLTDRQIRALLIYFGGCGQEQTAQKCDEDPEEYII